MRRDGKRAECGQRVYEFRWIEGGILSDERISYYLSKSRNNVDSDTAIFDSTGKTILLSDNP